MARMISGIYIEILLSIKESQMDKKMENEVNWDYTGVYIGIMFRTLKPLSKSLQNGFKQA